MPCLQHFMLSAVMCPALMDPLNGSVVWTDLSVSSVASYKCNEGFELKGSETRNCSNDGLWSGEDSVRTGI